MTTSAPNNSAPELDKYGHARYVHRRWERDPDGPSLPHPPPTGRRTPNGLIWGETLDDFFLISRSPKEPETLRWSRSMLLEFGENHGAKNAPREGEGEPTLVRPWPLLKTVSQVVDVDGRGDVDTLNGTSSGASEEDSAVAVADADESECASRSSVMLNSPVCKIELKAQLLDPSPSGFSCELPGANAAPILPKATEDLSKTEKVDHGSHREPATNVDPPLDESDLPEGPRKSIPAKSGVEEQVEEQFKDANVPPTPSDSLKHYDKVNDTADAIDTVEHATSISLTVTRCEAASPVQTESTKPSRASADGNTNPKGVEQNDQTMDEIGKARIQYALGVSSSQFSDFPKLEEFIPDEHCPDVLLVHDNNHVTTGTRGDLGHRYSCSIPLRYRRAFPAPTVCQEEKTSHLTLRANQYLGRGNHSYVYSAALTLMPPLDVDESYGSVLVAAKVAMPRRSARKLLANEARVYAKMPRHFQEEWSGLNLVPSLDYPVPVGPVAPKFFGWYVPENVSEEDWMDGNKPSPILLLEVCGEPIQPWEHSPDDL
jgi:hypothetical protein